jgi:hypothetical protein
MMVSSIGALNYLFSDQNKSDENIESDFRSAYDNFGGVSLFERGIHIIATNCDPLIMRRNSFQGTIYWQKLKESIATSPSSNDFISLVISRGDLPTGGYSIYVESLSKLEEFPVKLRLNVNFTNPGHSVIVTQAITNPLVLIPIGELDPGEYIVEIFITQFIAEFDDQGNTTYRQILTFKEEVWTESFIIISNQDS